MFTSPYTISSLRHIVSTSLYGIAFVSMCIPTAAHAASQLLISEVHYNPVGTDDKHEYVEVCNVSTESVDIASYKLYENQVNHGFTKQRGTSVLAEGTCAVLVTDPATFMADFPAFNGNLFDTSFSLSNSGEALVLRDGSGADVDGVSYTTAQGANGDGNSLHRVGTAFTGGAPSPGGEAGLTGAGTTGATNTSTPIDTPSTPTGGSATATTVFHTVTIEPPAQLFIRTDKVVHAATGTVVTFSASAHNAKGQKEDAQYEWVYGDGMRDATQTTNRQATHIYKHPGEYEAVVTAHKDGLSAEERVRVHIEDSSLTFAFTSSDSEVVLTNIGKVAVDLTGVRLATELQTYTFPQKTRLLPKQRIVLALGDIGLRWDGVRGERVVTFISADAALRIIAKAPTPSGVVLHTPVRASTNDAGPMTVLGFGSKVDRPVAVDAPQKVRVDTLQKQKASTTVAPTSRVAITPIKKEVQVIVTKKSVVPPSTTAQPESAEASAAVLAELARTGRDVPTPPAPVVQDETMYTLVPPLPSQQTPQPTGRTRQQTAATANASGADSLWAAVSCFMWGCKK